MDLHEIELCDETIGSTNAISFMVLVIELLSKQYAQWMRKQIRIS
jgi:hypothetical protein